MATLVQSTKYRGGEEDEPRKKEKGSQKPNNGGLYILGSAMGTYTDQEDVRGWAMQKRRRDEIAEGVQTGNHPLM